MPASAQPVATGEGTPVFEIMATMRAMRRLAGRSHGLAANLTIWHLVLEREYKDVLGIPPHGQAYGIVPIGRPLGRMGPVSRPTLSTVIHGDRWGGTWAAHTNKQERA